MRKPGTVSQGKASAIWRASNSAVGLVKLACPTRWAAHLRTHQDLVALLVSLTSPQYKELGDQEVCKATRYSQSEPPAARYGAGLRPRSRSGHPRLRSDVAP